MNWLSQHVPPTLVIIVISLLAYYFGNQVLGRLVGQIIKGGHREWHRKDIEKRQATLTGLFKSIWRIAIIIVVVVALFREFFPQVDMTPLFASAGIIGVALGFGAQSLIKDFISGIFIISENQYRVGDVIDVEGAAGTVERIGTRSTVLRDADGNVHYFPNGMVQHVINKTMGFSMARFSIDLKPSTDIDKVAEIIDATGKKLAEEPAWTDKIIEAPSFVSIGEFTANTVSLLISGKTQPSDQWAVTAEMRRRLLEQFEKVGIELGGPPLPPSARSKK